MKIAVYGPTKRLGLLVNGRIADMRDSCALYLQNAEHDPTAYWMADALVGDNLSSILNGGEKALETESKVEEYMRSSSETIGINSEPLLFDPQAVKLWPPIVDSSKIRKK